MKSYAGLSFWFDTLSEPIKARPSLENDLDVDVAIVGGGYTALWSAYYLRSADPNLSVAIFEREVCGYGASGRNGGWCSGKLAASWPRIARASGIDATTRL
ncbi:MAG: FAD-dependent oxidoreductase, partial [Acidimicrobiales bacterium]